MLRRYNLFRNVRLAIFCLSMSSPILAAPKQIVVTGAPASGKTSTLLQLEQMGFTILPEAARDSIQLELAKGSPRPYEHPDIELKIVDLYKIRADHLKGLSSQSFIFSDRSPLDTLAFVRFYKKNMPTAYYDELSKWTADPEVAKEVFLMEYNGKEEVDEVRTTNRNDCYELEKLLTTVYKEYGFKIHRIPFKSVVDRARDIIAQLENMGISALQ